MRELWTSFVDGLYPPQCHLCGGAADPESLGCAAHALELDRARPRCARCAAEIAPMLADGELCPECRREAPRFERALCVDSYRTRLAEWVLAFKHGGRRDLAEVLGALLAARLVECGVHAAGDRPRVLVPVPLHPLRRLERGYDQAALLARELARRTGIPLVPALRRTRSTRAQGSALAPVRHANVSGAFALRPFAARRLAGREAWLVDDVLTSGSTANECARVLERAGAVRVGVALVARASAERTLSPS